MRVMRLVRMLKMIKALYRLLVGVVESIKAMGWVIILTLLVLYACSIIFTNLIVRTYTTRQLMVLRSHGKCPLAVPCSSMCST